MRLLRFIANQDDGMSDSGRRLARSSYLSDSDLLSEESSTQYRAASGFVLERRCASNTTDPLILVYSPTNMTVRGTVDASGAIRYSGTVAGDASGPAAAGFEVPLRVSSLAGVPNEYLKNTLALVETRGIPPELAQRLRRELPVNYERLSGRAQGLIDHYSPSQCAPVAAPERRRAQATVVPPAF